jgi:tetratricopeptide (TPR) repeat protein
MHTALVEIAAILTLAPATHAPLAGPRDPAQLFESLSHQAEQARDAKRLDEALTLYRRALELNPTWEDGWWNAGNIAYDLDKYAECASALARLGELKPDLAPAWTLKGLCEYQLRDYDAALNSLTRVQRLKFPGNLELANAARLHLALVLTKLGYFEKAIVLLFDLAAVQQKTPELIAAAGIAGLRKRWIPPEVPGSDQDKVFKLGEAMATVMLRDYKVAIDKFEAALRDYPQEPDFHYRFGAFLMMVNDPDRGIQEIKKTLDLQPGHVPALVALAKIYLKRNEPQIAVSYAKKAVELSPGDFSTHVTLGQALLATGDTAGAVRELELGVRLAPESPEVHYNLGTAYGRMGRKADAEREREKSKRLRESLDSNPP